MCLTTAYTSFLFSTNIITKNMFQRIRNFKSDFVIVTAPYNRGITTFLYNSVYVYVTVMQIYSEPFFSCLNVDLIIV